MLIRVRTNVGVWRIDKLNDATSTVSDILKGIAETRPLLEYTTETDNPLFLDPSCKHPLDASATLKSQNITHGSMVHTRVNPATCTETTNSGSKKTIAKDGSIHIAEGVRKDGFRKGMLALRDMKMHWTLTEFSAMDDKYNFKLKRQPESFIPGGVSLDTNSCNDFQRYLSQFQFQRERFGYLYGKFEDDGKKVKVEAIYEPAQVADPNAAEGFEMLDDPKEERVEELAALLGMEKVGWIFGHPKREKGFTMSSAEVIMAAELQVEKAEGIEETPFVTVKVTVGEDGKTSFEAFQVSLQCMEMVSEEILVIDPDDPKLCKVNDTYTVIQEGKSSKTVENDFLLTTVPIVQHESDIFLSEFPRANREGEIQTFEEMKNQLSKSGKNGWNFIDLLSDFHLLLYLCDFLDFKSDMVKICSSVVDRTAPLDDGYKIIIKSMAGMDGSY